jgi:5'-nucleotidase
MRPHLFVDSDGVFADFDRHVFNEFGRWPNELGDALMWSLVQKTPGFWGDMPLKAGAHELWEFVKPFAPTVLTGCPRTNYELADRAKREWWKRHFDHEQVITCFSRDKPLHMRSPGDILVDDMAKNVKKWEKAGGVAVLHRDAGSSIERLTEIFAFV